MTRHTPAALALALGLVGATGLMAGAPTHDVDAVTETPVTQAQATPRTDAGTIVVAQAPTR